MLLIYISSIIAGFILFLITKNNFRSEVSDKRKQNLYKAVNGVGITVLTVSFLYYIFRTTVPRLYFTPMVLVIFLLSVISAILYIKSIKLAIKGKPKKTTENNSKYYLSFKVVTVVVCLLSTALDFVAFGFLIDWRFEPEMSFVIIPFCLALSVLYTYIYFLPYLIAVKRQHKQKRAIYILNIFTSWTIIIWIIALVWANTESKETVIINQTSDKVSSTDELLSYKKLLDENVITQEDFDAKKKQILGL